MTNEPIHRVCFVCGYKLPQLSIDDLMAKGAVSTRGDGSRLFHCPKHTEQEITDALTTISGFQRASEIRK